MPMIGMRVFSSICGKIVSGRVTSVIHQKIGAMLPGTKFLNEFRVKWDNPPEDSEKVSVFQLSEFGESVFETKAELILKLRDTHKASLHYNVDTCRDFYGLILKVGDHVRKMNTDRAVEGYISEIYFSKRNDFESPYVIIENDEGLYVAFDDNPKRYTTVARIERMN